MSRIEELEIVSWEDFDLPNDEGFLDKTVYPKPQGQEQTRKQLQSQHSQIKEYINGTLVPRVNESADVTDESITNIETDSTLRATRVGHEVTIEMIETPTGVRKEYVDEQDADVLQSAQSYTNTKIATLGDMAYVNYEVIETL